MDEQQNDAGEAATAPSIFDNPEYLKIQARSAALAHAVSLCGVNNHYPAKKIVEDAEAFAAFLLG
jgi:hypothetical protein